MLRAIITKNIEGRTKLSEVIVYAIDYGDNFVGVFLTINSSSCIH